MTAEPGKVHFEWDLSSSADVVEYKFQRKPNGAPGWATLVAFVKTSPISVFTDSTASVRRYWDYRLLAIDDVGLIGSSKVIKAKPVDNGIRAAITNFSGSAPPDAAELALGWDYPKNDPDLMGFEIFRAIGSNEKRSFKFITFDEALSAGGAVPGTLFGYLDSDLDFKVPVQTSYNAPYLDATTVVTGGNVTVNGNTTTVTPQSPNVPSNPQAGITLRYWVIAKYFDGAMSPLSTEVTIQL